MKKRKIVTSSIVILGLILVSIISFRKWRLDDTATEMTNNSFQSEEQADLEVEFNKSESDKQHGQENTMSSDKSKDSSEEKGTQTFPKQENSKKTDKLYKTNASEQVEDLDETKNPEQEDSDESMNPEEEKDSENPNKDEMWTGYY